MNYHIYIKIRQKLPKTNKINKILHLEEKLNGTNDQEFYGSNKNMPKGKKTTLL